MNLKEAFRYQNFLEGLFDSATSSIMDSAHCLKITKNHMKSKTNPDAEDIIEEVAVEDFFSNDDVITFMEYLIQERQKLTDAIEEAKKSVGWSIDSAIATNKFRQRFKDSIKYMLRLNPSKKTEQAMAYKFNNEGNQAPYYYDVEVIKEDNYDRDGAKKAMKRIIAEADRISTNIDSAMVNTTVNYSAVFDVNDTFDDAMRSFLWDGIFDDFILS